VKPHEEGKAAILRNWCHLFCVKDGSDGGRAWAFWFDEDATGWQNAASVRVLWLTALLIARKQDAREHERRWLLYIGARLSQHGQVPHGKWTDWSEAEQKMWHYSSLQGRKKTYRKQFMNISNLLSLRHNWQATWWSWPGIVKHSGINSSAIEGNGYKQR
jgi:hypothetical protein